MIKANCYLKQIYPQQGYNERKRKQATNVFNNEPGVGVKPRRNDKSLQLHKLYDQ